MKFLPYVFIYMLSTSCSSKTVPNATAMVPAFTREVEKCLDCIVITEQSQNRIVIVDLGSKKFVWEWKAENSNVQPAHVKWFVNPSDAKPVYDKRYVKSISSGPGHIPIIISRPKEQWWTDELFDSTGKSIFKQPGLKIYKARWWFLNLFSYDGNAFGYSVKDSIKVCR